MKSVFGKLRLNSCTPFGFECEKNERKLKRRFDKGVWQNHLFASMSSLSNETNRSLSLCRHCPANGRLMARLNFVNNIIYFFTAPEIDYLFTSCNQRVRRMGYSLSFSNGICFDRWRLLCITYYICPNTSQRPHFMCAAMFSFICSPFLCSIWLIPFPSP